MLFLGCCSPSNEDPLEAIVILDIPLDDIAIVLSNDHIFELDYPTTEPSPDFPFELDLTICRASYIGVEESSVYSIELQVGVPCVFDALHRYLASPNDEFLLVASIIDVNFDLLVKCDLTMYTSRKFGVNESWLIDYTKVMYTT